MKVKWDFVTNSSSCCFLLTSESKITKTILYDKGVGSTEINALTCINDIEKLMSYAEGNINKPCDWIMKVRGPKNFWGMTPEWYHKSKKIIENGNYVVCVDVERNFEGVQGFESAIMTMDCKIIDRYYD